MGDTLVDVTNPNLLSSKRKFGNIKFDGHKNSYAESLMGKLNGFENLSFDQFEVNVDQDYRRFLIGDMRSIPNGDVECNGNDNGVDDDDAVDIDPQYEIFLSNLTVDGNSIVLQANEKTCLSEPFKYYSKDDSADEPDLDTQRKRRNVIGENVGSGSRQEAPIVFSDLPRNQRRQPVNENDTRYEPVNSNPLGDNRSLDEGVGNEGTYASDGKRKTKFQGEERKSQKLRKSRKVAKVVKSEAAGNVKKINVDECDDDYLIYCNNLSIEDNHLVLKYKNSSTIVYEADNYVENVQTNNSAHSVKETIEIHADAGGSDPSGDHDCHYLGSPSRESHSSYRDQVMGIMEKPDDDCHYHGSPSRESHSSFRKEVLSILGRPYDSEEHQMLLQNVQARKSVERNLDLRFGREQPYSVNKDGKSYLDHYYDLKRKFQAAKSKYEQLNLLRGFFFWLQNLTREGAFKPWQDKSCLDVQPQCC
ncbi:hypothetical protein ACH5RR_026449 [Cinchona calisaya]|uniref:Uncharacterized protein n=1 Tax=Cinchona calisaya TaxID=153742 RepID=A0ABD2Z2L5_9GENT